MSMKVVRPFAWAHRGVDIEHFEQDRVIDPANTDPELLVVATREGWITATDGQKASAPPTNKARKSAPENK